MKTFKNADTNVGVSRTMDETDDETTSGSSTSPELSYSEGESAERSDRPEDTEYELEALRFICSESRTVIDHQIDDLDDIDDKALRTVRITMVGFGLVVAAAQVENADPLLNRMTVLGSGFLLCSIITGVFTYSASDLHLGPGPAYLSDVIRQTNSEATERIMAIETYAYWMYENEG